MNSSSTQLSDRFELAIELEIPDKLRTKAHNRYQIARYEIAIGKGDGE